jgi:hypothetical protein
MSSPLIEFLAKELRMSEREVQVLIATAPERYKVYNIRKRTGGLREIAQPASELKAAQRALVREYLSKLPVHFCATAYKPGSSIRKNAEIHSHNRPILKYDFEEFFPSITERAWISYCEHHEIFDRADAVRSGRIFFRRPKGGRILRLSIGAPSSPVLSNVLLNAFDSEIYDRVSDHKVTYTRYADDMTFSAQRTGNLTVVDKILRSVINRMHAPKLKINEKKTVLVTPKFHRQVTGVVLTNDERVSIGRDRKRSIRAAIHHFATGKLNIDQAVKVAGLLAFAKDVEPQFYARMERVYGREVIQAMKALVKDYHRPR